VAIGAVVSITATIVGCTGVADGSALVVLSDGGVQALLRSRIHPSHAIYLCKGRFIMILCSQIVSFASILQYVVCV
jgi:hypothetical protein